MTGVTAARDTGTAALRTQLEQARRLQQQGQMHEAIALLQQVLSAAPGLSEVQYELAYALKAVGRHAEALVAFDQALALGIERAHEVHLNRAVLFADHLRRDDQAQQALLAALALQPSYVPALLNLGNLHEQRGERQQALDCYDRLLAADPTGLPREHVELRMVALARTAIMRPPTEREDPQLAALQHASAAVPHNPTVRANLLFALGQSYDRLAEYDLAFDAFAKANRCLLRQSGRLYDRAHAAALNDALIDAFGSAKPVLASDSAADVENGAKPLFICGMYRSGSTLVEQVLAAHPKVIAGGELDWLLRVAAQRMDPFPASMRNSTPQTEVALAQEYRQHLHTLFPAAGAGTFITDKRPDNFQLIGLIKRLFPNAKIIHTTRNPLDNGLSVFMQHLILQVAGYAHDLGDIGHYYGQYRRLMQHWKSLYPEDIFDFDYDEFVRAPQPALERLLEFLGLEWDARCLEFHTLRNTVKTASYWQVRRPLYGDASGRWRNYRTHLRPLMDALMAGGVEPNWRT